MLDLSTINGSTINQPATLAIIKEEVGVINNSGDANKANTLLSYLKRLLPSDPNNPITQRYSPLLDLLAQTTPVSLIKSKISQPGEARVPVRNVSGEIKFFQLGHFVDQPPSVFKKSKPAASFGELPKSVGAFQAKLESSSAHKPVPVSYESPEDEEEIRRNTNRLSSFDLEDGHDIDSLLERIAEKNHLILDSDLIKKRFFAIGTARLKEIRSSRETRELLTRTPKIGGLGLEQNQAQAVAEDFNKASDKVRDELPSVHPSPAAVRLEAPIPKPPKIPEPFLSKKNLQPASKAAAALGSEAGSSQVPVKAENTPAPVPKYQATNRPVIPIRLATQSDRPIVEDIKAPDRPRRLVGPVEELGSLSIEGFRKLGEDSGSQVRKVYEKITLLGQESFSKRIEGIQAWRQSPTHKLYLSMSRESLEQGLDIKEVVKAREIASQPLLTEAEYHAIVDLNRKLRF
ncbi:MAG: hypothetical protein V1853_05220 [bacterium]